MIERQEVILAELQREEARFLETLERGEKLLAEVLASKPTQISGAQAFELYDTYGFPPGAHPGNCRRAGPHGGP